MTKAAILFVPIAAAVGLVIGIAGAVFMLGWMGVKLFRASRLTIDALRVKVTA